MNDTTDDLSVLDPTSSIMAEAVASRSLKHHVRVRKIGGEKRYWLGFLIRDQEFLYKAGVIREYGRGWIDQDLGQNINHPAHILVADKHGTKKHLQTHGINVPNGYLFRRRNLDKILGLYEHLTPPLCVKPNNGRRGSCVTTSINNHEQYAMAVRTVADQYKTVVVEESVPGDHFRFFYVHPRVVGIRHGMPLSVVGDGESTIADLLERKNAARRERGLPTHPVIDIDDGIVRYLSAQGLSTQSVLQETQRVFLRSSAGYPEGADTILLDADSVHESYPAIVEKACRSVQGLYICGVDIVIRDITQPATDDNYWILELNANPAIMPFYHPWEGNTVDVAGKIIDMLIAHYPFDA